MPGRASEMCFPLWGWVGFRVGFGELEFFGGLEFGVSGPRFRVLRAIHDLRVTVTDAGLQPFKLKAEGLTTRGRGIF